DTGDELKPGVWALARAVSTGIVSPSQVVDIQRMDGTRGTILNAAVPIREHAGDIVGGLAAFQDVTEQRGRERLSTALAEIEAVVASEQDVEDVLDRVLAETSRAIHADSAVIYTRRAGLWVVQRTYGRLKELIGRAFTNEEVWYAQEEERTRELVAIPDTSKDVRVNRALAERYGVGALIDGAIFLRGELVGDLSFHYNEPRASFSQAELDFVRDVAFAVSQSLKTAALFQGERVVAHAMQRALLQLPESVRGIDYVANYTSASEIAEIGGDFYDLLPLPDRRVAIVIGDVSGHALEAARLMMTVKHAIRAYAFDGQRPADTLRKANELLVAVTAFDIFSTVFLGVLDTDSGVLTYCSAGHPPAFLRRRSGELVRLAVQSPLLGGLPGFDYVQAEETLDRGDYLFLYTDGAYEARNDGEMFGENRLAELVEDSPSGQEACDRVSQEVTAFSGGRLEDDLAMLAVSLA
ncbi:MAG: SpoIIE family protein phosphatase, partial [Actinomycetota bacterium]|nr:SpoIIE family protein phosphatase [Actinomycetota bacterium]